MKKYRLVFIDDEINVIDTIINAVKDMLRKQYTYDVSYKIISNQEEIDQLNDMVADIVLFDCALGAAKINFEGLDETTYGIEIMKQFRRKNERTKIIFYSGRFSLTGTQCYDFTNMEILNLINELHIYKMIPKSAKEIAKSIVEAINELDAITVSVEELKEEYQNDGEFLVDNQKYSISELLSELKRNSKVADEFRREVYKLVITYMMKFGGDED